MTMMTHILLIILATLFLFYLALQILNLVVLRSMMVADLRSDGARVLDHGVRSLESNIFEVFGFWTAVLV